MLAENIGLLILSLVLSVIGWFIKRELSGISQRLENHDAQILALTGSVSELVGAFSIASKKFL